MLEYRFKSYFETIMPPVEPLRALGHHYPRVTPAPKWKPDSLGVSRLPQLQLSIRLHFYLDSNTKENNQKKNQT